MKVARVPAPCPLIDLAKVIAASSRRGLTPVIVCDRSLTLRDAFYVALCEAVRAQSGREIRLDLLPGHRLEGMLGRLRRRQQVQRLRRRLAAVGAVDATVALSRSIHPSSNLVIGFAGPNDELPTYAKPIELAA